MFFLGLVFGFAIGCWYMALVEKPVCKLMGCGRFLKHDARGSYCAICGEIQSVATDYPAATHETFFWSHRGYRGAWKQ
jgi:hypothetical protein